MRRFLFLCFLFPTLAFASDLMAPFTLENSRVLPPGVRNPHYLEFFGSLQTRYDGAGNLIPLGFRTNVRATWKDVLETQSDEAQRNMVRAILNDNHLDPDGSPGNTTGAVNVHADVKAPVFAMGLTDRLTVAVVVPVVTLDAKVDTGFVKSADGQRFVSAVCEQSPEQCNDAAAKLNRATDQKIELYHYQPLTSQTVSAVGDVQLVSKYQCFGDEEQGFSVKLGLVLPTGIGPNVDNALDLPTGDGRFKVGPTVFYDVRPIDNSRVSFYAGYLALLPNRMDRRIPYTDDNLLSNDRVSLVKQRGENLTFGSTLNYTVPDIATTFAAGYNFQQQTQTRYKGDNLSADQQSRLVYLENLDPTETLHSLVAQLSFSTVDWYFKKKFPLPFQLNVLYSHPIAGWNVPTNDIFSGEAVFFF